MKAIVANVFFGGIFGCLSCANSTQATPVKIESIQPKQIVSARLSSKFSVPAPQLFKAIDRVLTINGLQNFNSVGASLNTGYQQSFDTNSFSFNLSPQQPYIHKSDRSDLVLGFQKTFWSSKNQHQYWGITTVEHWGKNKQQTPSPSNYADSPPTLALGSSTLTFSGGGNHNLAKSATLERDFNGVREFEDFRGGITYHHGISKQLTMGVGFVYENALIGFTQLTYNSNILPIKTTVSLMAQESGIDLQAHIRFQPASNFVANYYRTSKKQKFDVNWSVYPGLTLVARGNNHAKSYSTGVKIAIQNNYFFLSATAALDNEQNLQWQLNSQIGGVQFAYSSNQERSNLELSSQLFDSNSLGIQCSGFVRYQVSGKNEKQEFTVWGAKIHSQTIVNQNRYQWNFDLGYGNSSDGQGWIVNGNIALQPNLFLKLGYQEISAVSDETKIKLQLSSN